MGLGCLLCSYVFIWIILLFLTEDCILEYSLEVLQITEPAEDRMEQALFSPPLSKQRVEFAVGIINNAHAASLVLMCIIHPLLSLLFFPKNFSMLIESSFLHVQVDFGCGSGSLLDSLLEHPTTLEKIVGVDISLKSLSRAAKV